VIPEESSRQDGYRIFLIVDMGEIEMRVYVVCECLVADLEEIK
jgi:hypothetical protein